MNSRRMNDHILEICDESGNVVISLKEEFKDNAIWIEAAGEIKNEVAHDFEDEIMAAFSVCSQIRIDLSKVTYIASLAMRALLSVQQIMDENTAASLKICGLSSAVKETFNEAGFLDILSIEE